MSRVLFIPNDQTVIFLDTPLTHAGLACMIDDGRWQPPPPFEKLAGSLRMVDEGRLVIILGPDTLLPPAENSGLLNQRERDIVQGLADGLFIREIAVRVGLHRRTVDWYIGRLRNRLGASSNKNLVAQAAALGLCSIPPNPDETR